MKGFTLLGVGLKPDTEGISDSCRGKRIQLKLEGRNF